MKIIVLLTILTLSLASIATAGLNNHEVVNNAIAVYYFEGLEDTSIRNADGELSGGASLTNNGIWEQGLQITGEGSFRGNLEVFPILIGLEFSITARVKIPRQTTGYIHVAIVSTTTETILPIGTVVLCVTPEGNLRGERGTVLPNLDQEMLAILESEGSNVTDNRWHHIAFTKYGHTYALFLDGEVIETFHSDTYKGLGGDESYILAHAPKDKGVRGNAIVDNLGFFETGFSPYEIKALYQVGLHNFMEVMPVSPRNRLATTWGEIKSQ